ncbi:MAG: DMT family transporter [Erysipelotrichaceae bacterium]|nr:DMT family transporter [Erysipelotrichaceae bacterium]
MNKNLKGNLILLLTALIWGVAFTAQSSGMNYVGPYTFNAIRNFLATLCLLPLVINNSKNKPIKDSIPGGIACGIVLAIAMALQQIGIQYTTAGKAGFITALYLIIVPLLGIFIGKLPSLKAILCALLALFGLYLLTYTSSVGFVLEDGYLIGCAFVFALHILVIDHFTLKADGITMSCIQFLVAGIISLIPMFITEGIQLNGIKDALIPILYAGCLSSGAGYTLQIIGQKYADPNQASLILSLESVFSLLAGAILLNERLSTKELLGCALVFIAILLSQIEFKKKEL